MNVPTWQMVSSSVPDHRLYVTEYLRSSRV